ncbi:MAG TPA: FlgD immunoglobulin-like domain containing protein, partial [Candidatus Edwardsbacteria bacterium]|nr:FlgD immunoglobulin-like domain containing protein [Candidatus Edwardsbacteria bacterium]
WGIARQDTFLFISVRTTATQSWIISLNIADPANPMIVDSVGGSFGAGSVVAAGRFLYAVSFTPIIDISDPANMSIRGNTPVSGGNGKMAIADTILYTPNMAGFSGYLFYNVANPDAVTLIKNYPSVYYSRDVFLEGSTLYLGDDQGGLRIVSVADPANPAEAGHCSAPAIYGKGAIADTRGYFPSDGMHVFDLADSSRPRQVGYFPSAHGGYTKIVVRDTLAFAAEAQLGLRIIDIADPAAPITVDSVRIPGFTGGLALRDSFVYYAQDTLYVINVADARDPYIAGKLKTAASAGDITIEGDRGYVAAGSAGLRIVDLSDPAHPAELGFDDTPGTASDVAVRDTFAYVADGNGGLRVINVANPASPVETGSWSLGLGSFGGAQAVALDGNLAYVAYDTFGVRVVDIADPAHPVEAGHYQYRTYGTSDWYTVANGVSISNSNAYVSYLSHGLQVFQYSGPTGAGRITNDEVRIANALGFNRPNPFATGTAISYQLSTASTVTLIVYNVAGQQVRTLASGPQQAGTHEARWNGRSDAGRQLPAGVYFCRLCANGKTMITKMVKVK